MKNTVVAAITAAVNAYMEQDAQPEQAIAVPARISPLPVASTWRDFGRQEAIRRRSQWQARRRTR